MEVSEGEMIWEEKCGRVDAPNSFDRYLHSVMTKCSLRDCLQRKNGNLKETDICHLPCRMLMGKINVSTMERTDMAQGNRGRIRHGDRCIERRSGLGKKDIFLTTGLKANKYGLVQPEANAINSFLLRFACMPTKVIRDAILACLLLQNDLRHTRCI